MRNVVSLPVVDTELARAVDTVYAHATPPTPFSSLIQTIFGDANNSSRKTVLFTAAEPGAGVSSVACTVAAELAAAGRRVLLAEAGVIASLSEYEDALSLCDQAGCERIWTLGPEQARRSGFPLNPARGQPAMVLSALLEEFQHVVLDAPALSESQVAVRLAPSLTGVVLVVRKDKTETRRVVKACRLFTATGGTILGSVYNAY